MKKIKPKDKEKKSALDFADELLQEASDRWWEKVEEGLFNNDINIPKDNE